MKNTTDPLQDIALYVHWPFCVSKCPYCDFNSHVADTVDHGLWREALLRELAHAAGISKGRRLTSVFFGGGTPSLMDPVTTRAVLDAARTGWRVADDLEVTLEANPGTVDAKRFEDFAVAGVNRLSLGVQSLDDDALSFLGRRHSAAEAINAVREAGKAFHRLSFDLIYARPGQTNTAWERELNDALDLLADAGGAHLSAYQLTIEENTPFHGAYKKGVFVLPEEDAGADLYETTERICAGAGLEAYEVSNYAKPDDACRHNLHVWQGGDYAGIGPGAHGRQTQADGTHAIRRIKAPGLWLKRALKDNHGTQENAALSVAERAEEVVLLGLRLRGGLDLAVFEKRTGCSPFDVIDKNALKDLQTAELLEATPAHIAVTPKGRLVLNALTRELLV